MENNVEIKAHEQLCIQVKVLNADWQLSKWTVIWVTESDETFSF